MDHLVEYSLKHRCFARCTIRESDGTSRVADMHAGSRDPKTIPLPEGTESFKLFERVQGYAMVNGKAVFVRSDDFNISPGDHYPNATRHTLAEYAALFPEACLVDATRTDLVMVRTQGGRWHRLGPDDAIVERKR